MTDLSNATLPQLWLRVQRLRLARWAIGLAAPSPTSPNGSCPRICGASCDGLSFLHVAGFDLLFAGAETPRPWM